MGAWSYETSATAGGMIVQLPLIAGGTLVSEDLTCIATGVLVAQHRIGFLEGTLACFAGIFVGDLLLILAGRWAGSLLTCFVPSQKLDNASAWLSARGLSVVLISRFTPGLRLPVYLAA
jgi:membrane protein DedA with SNARE-associated domain